MSRRTQTYQVIPWVGGINTSIDSGVLNSQELVKADNVVFSATGARIKRDGLEYLDPEVPTPTFRSSSGTTRTLKFAVDALVTTSPTNEKLVVGERISVTGVTTYAATNTPVLTRTDLGGGVYSITYEAASSLTESETAAGTISIKRASSVISHTDYWRFTTDAEDTQLSVYATDDFQLFYLDESGRRVQIKGQELVQTITSPAASSITAGHYFSLFSGNDATTYYVWFKIDGSGSDPTLAEQTGIEVDIASTDDASAVATAIATAISASDDFVATADSEVVTATCVSSGITSQAAAGTTTGFTFAIVTYGATAPTTAVNSIRTLVFNERLILYFSGLGNKPIKWNPDENTKYQLLDPNAPDASFGLAWLGRIWCNDKTNKGRFHYCETFDETLWLGLGDSGAIDVYPGDGDPEGIVNGYVYKGMLVVGKKAKRYRIEGDSPENFYVDVISEGMGNEGAFTIPVDETDVVFISRRGVHSQAATDAYGDTDSQYLSSDIKPTFNSWSASLLKYSQGVYIPELNSIAISVAESGQNSQNAIWLYNFEIQVPNKPRPGVWYRWPNISCTALSRRYTNSKYKLVIGTSDGRLIQAQKENTYRDFGAAGIPYLVKTGTIYPNNDPHSIKAFKKISMIYRPKGNFTFSVKAKIDNQQAQLFGFNQIAGLDLLGTTFILGASTLGSSATLAPFTLSMDGFGRGVTLEISQNSADEQVEIWGFIIEYENADLNQANDNDAVSSG